MKTTTKPAKELTVGDEIFDYQKGCALLSYKSSAPITHTFKNGTIYNDRLVTVLTRRGYVEYDADSLITVKAGA